MAAHPAFFDELGIGARSPGAYDGTWISTRGPLLEVKTPVTGASLGTVTEAGRDEYEQLRAEGQKAANILHFNERATRRRLIDEELIGAGWDVGQNGKSTEQVRQEVQVSAMPTPSGEGFADYVLYGDDGKPLAVLEAKKTSKGPPRLSSAASSTVGMLRTRLLAPSRIARRGTACVDEEPSAACITSRDRRAPRNRRIRRRGRPAARRN